LGKENRDYVSKMEHSGIELIKGEKRKKTHQVRRGFTRRQGVQKVIKPGAGRKRKRTRSKKKNDFYIRKSYQKKKPLKITQGLGQFMNELKSRNGRRE